QICQGQSTILTATFSPNTSNLSWAPGSATTSTISVSPTGNTNYTVTASNGACKDSASVSVTVNLLPVLNTVTSQTNICAGSAVSAINLITVPASSNVGWTNTNTATGIAANGTGNINGYTAPNVNTQQTSVVTAIPVDPATTCVGLP